MAGTWSFLLKPGPFSADSQAEPDAMLLLTDGSVLIHDADPGTAWWRLFPSPSGSYSDGSWIGPFDMEYQRQSFASGIMMDGRVFVVGGEYTNDPNTFEKPGTYSPTGEIFDPDADSWTQLPKPLTPPPAFNYIAGDASSCVLPDGRVLFGSYKDRQSAIYDPSTETWKEAGLGTGNVPTRQEDCNEETWTLLPDGSVLTVCTFDTAPGTSRAALRYLPGSDIWVSAGQTPQELPIAADREIGPAILLPDGTLFAIGATGATGIYTPPPSSAPAGPGGWASGPPLVASGAQLTCIDAPAALMTSGKVLCVAGPSQGTGANLQSQPAMFLEYDYTTGAVQVGDQIPADFGLDNLSTNMVKLLLLPTGQVLMTCLEAICLYTPQDRAPMPAWAATIKSAPARISGGDTFTISGTLLNGLSQAVSFGDDYTAATNYPIVRLEQGSNVLYCKTSDFSTLGVALVGQVVSAQVDVPSQDAQMVVGPAELTVIANGIPSPSVGIIYLPTGTQAAPNPLVWSGYEYVTYGGLGDGPSVTFAYKGGHLVAVIHHPPIWSGEAALLPGEAAILTMVYVNGIAARSVDARLNSYLHEVVKSIGDEHSGQIVEFLER